MGFVKKCKRVWGSSKGSLEPDEDTGCSSGSYSKLSEKHKQKEKKNNKKSQMAPHGCLSVYVGPERQRFVIKIKIANHPLFKMLLDAAENEYGYRNDGPLWLPSCDVDLFCEALAEMESSTEDDMGSVGCTFPVGHSKHSSSSVSHSPLSFRSNLSCDADYHLLV